MDLQQKTKPSTKEGLVDKILFYHKIKQCYVGRHGGLMVSTFFSRLSGLCSSPGQGHCIVFSGVTLNSEVPLSTQVYKSVPATLMLGVTHQWTSIPTREE